MTTIIQFPLARIARKALDVVEGEVVAEVPPDALPAGHGLAAPVGNRVAHHSRKRRPSAKAKAKPEKRAEPVAVVCSRTPRSKHKDLRGLAGVLVIDWKGSVPDQITFDPSDESVENIVAPVEAWNRTPTHIAVETDEGAWLFTLLVDEPVVRG